MNVDERRELSRLAHTLRWAPKTKQDRRIGERIRHTLEVAVYEAVDALFAWFTKDGRPRALVIHQGTAWVADPETKDYRIFVQQHAASVVGTYDRKATRSQIFEDIKETMPALASVLR